MMRELTNTHLDLHGVTLAEYVAQFGNPNRKIREAKLREQWGHLPLGQVPDSTIAEMAGISRRDVCNIRLALGIPAFIGLILTQEGVPTRSILEARYDAWLHWKGVEHAHEVPVPTLPYIADFKVGAVFVEIVGMQGFGRYADKLARKQVDYEKYGIRVTWLTAEMVDQMFRDCPIPLKFRTRTCADCGRKVREIVNGMCRPCARMEWGEANGTEVTCEGCEKPFTRAAGSPHAKFCSHACYAGSLELGWPSWEMIDARLREVSVRALARELGVKPSALYMRLRRRRERDASAPEVRDTRRKLTEDAVREIRRRCGEGETQATLSRKFGVDPVTIYQVVHLKTWAKVA
jgi:transposase-like protein/endogenous inhibitor of DNA gyrase (YacG/DUF329 family)